MYLGSEAAVAAVVVAKRASSVSAGEAAVGSMVLGVTLQWTDSMAIMAKLAPAADVSTVMTTTQLIPMAETPSGLFDD